MCNLTCRVGRYHNSVVEDMGLLAWDGVLLDEWFWLLKLYSAFISRLSSPWRIWAPRFLRTMGTSHSATWCHIPEEMNPCHFTCSFSFLALIKLICRSILMISVEFLHLIILHFNLMSMSQSFWWNKYRGYIIFVVATSAFYIVWKCLKIILRLCDLNSSQCCSCRIHSSGIWCHLIGNLLVTSRRSLLLPLSRSAIALIMEEGSSSHILLTDYR